MFGLQAERVKGEGWGEEGEGGGAHILPIVQTGSFEAAKEEEQTCTPGVEFINTKL